MFVQRLNAQGVPEWVAVDDEGSDTEELIAGLLNQSLYLDMLHDDARNRAYRLALDDAISGGCKHVLDIGTGTGLLALLAAQRLRDIGSDAHVTACELFPPMAALARRVVATNGMDDRVRIVGRRSDELVVDAGGSDSADMPQKADVIVTEIFDSELLGEGIIPTMRHAVEHLLTEGGKVIPAGATVWAQVIESATLWRCSDLAGVEVASRLQSPLAYQPVPEDEPEVGKPKEKSDKSTLPNRNNIGGGRGQVGGILRPLHINPLQDEVRPLTAPKIVFEFDFLQPPPAGRSAALQVPVIQDGMAHAIVMWWDLHMDGAGSIGLSTRPSWLPNPTPAGAHGSMLDQGWRDHWKPCWSPILPARRVAQHDALELLAAHDDISISLSFPSATQTSSLTPETLPWTAACSPVRTWALGDEDLRQSYQHAVAKIGAMANPGTTAITLGDGPLLTALASSSSNFSHIISIQESSLGLASVAQVTEALGTAGHVTMCTLEDALLQREGLGEESSLPATVLLAEPFYQDCEADVPWAHLRFWSEREALLQTGLLASNHVVLPATGRLCGVLVSLPDLFRTHQPMGAAEGVDLSSCSRVLGRRHPSGADKMLARPLWQCGAGYQELTQRFVLFSFDFSTAEGELGAPLESTVHARVKADGIAHVLVTWMEYSLLSGCSGSVVRGMCSEAGEPDHRLQGIHLLDEPLEVDRGSSTSGGAEEYNTQVSRVDLGTSTCGGAEEYIPHLSGVDVGTSTCDVAEGYNSHVSGVDLGTSTCGGAQEYNSHLSGVNAEADIPHLSEPPRAGLEITFVQPPVLKMPGFDGMTTTSSSSLHGFDRNRMLRGSDESSSGMTRLTDVCHVPGNDASVVTHMDHVTSQGDSHPSNHMAHMSTKAMTTLDCSTHVVAAPLSEGAARPNDDQRKECALHVTLAAAFCTSSLTLKIKDIALHQDQPAVC